MEGKRERGEGISHDRVVVLVTHVLGRLFLVFTGHCRGRAPSYRECQRGVRAGESVNRDDSMSRDSHDVSWLSYLGYGHVCNSKMSVSLARSELLQIT